MWVEEYIVWMSQELERLRLAQETLDDLFRKHLIPYKLTADKVVEELYCDAVYFRKGPIQFVAVGRQSGGPFKDRFREAVLKAVGKSV